MFHGQVRKISTFLVGKKKKKKKKKKKNKIKLNWSYVYQVFAEKKEEKAFTVKISGLSVSMKYVILTWSRKPGHSSG